MAFENKLKPGKPPVKVSIFEMWQLVSIALINSSNYVTHDTPKGKMNIEAHYHHSHVCTVVSIC